MAFKHLLAVAALLVLLSVVVESGGKGGHHAKGVGHHAKAKSGGRGGGGGHSGGGGGKSYAGGSGVAKTTRYWDCCKPSCAWSANTGSVSAPVRTCKAGGQVTAGNNEQSGCNGGSAFVCNDQRPFVQGGQAYGFAAANVNNLPMNQMCCACYKLTFTNTAVKGQNMIVQVTNTGSDLGTNHFDIQLPASGMGIFDQGCQKQWPQTSTASWGARYGGISGGNQCSAIPKALASACQFRFSWFKNADNPQASFQRVACPAAITNISKCKRNDD